MSENYFLSNKFTLASLPENVMPRTELLPLYDKAAGSRFVFVSAPAGSGKTVSALLWLEHSGRENVPRRHASCFGFRRPSPYKKQRDF
jgi:ATP/maltotriose-dependent transcriptional regulator MalT